MPHRPPQPTLAHRARQLARRAAALLPRSSFKRASLAAAVLACLVLLVVLSLYLASRKTPSYWARNQQLLAADNATLMQLANQLEQQVLRDLSGSQQVQPPTRQVRLSFEQINAWLHVKLEDHLANRQVHLPDELRQIMLAGEEGRLIIAFEYHSPQLKQVVSAAILPHFDETSTRFKLELVSVKAGLVPLPITTLRNRIAQQAPHAKQRVDQFFDMLGNQWLEAVQHHPGDARLNLRVTGIDIDEEGITLTLRSEPRRKIIQNPQDTLTIPIPD